MTGPVHAVYDCMILLQAAARPSRVHATMHLVSTGQVALYISPEILEEVSDVLTRPEVQQKFPDLRPPVAAAFLQQLQEIAILKRNVPDLFTLPRDPKDEPYTNLAIAVQPSCIVTWNQKHLTYLIRQDTPEGIEFCRRFPDVQIMDPPSFVQFVNARK